MRKWWWRESVREYLPILAVNEPSLINWLNQYGFAKVCSQNYLPVHSTRLLEVLFFMARYQGQNKKGTLFVMNLKSYVPCHLILQTYVIFQLEL